ncbi:MAG: hypothetical protein E7235_01730 [Lachnospiraceae bacterium]|nr:hypothetical protein [Lachnospiraceae bacterium]
MVKKFVAVVAVAACAMIGLSMRIYGVNELREGDFVNINSENSRAKISEKVLNDTGRISYINAEDIRSIKTARGDIDGDGTDDVVLALDYGPDLSVIAVYKADDNDTYLYLGEIGPLETITALETKRLAAENRDVIAIKEESTQRLGAYEYNVFVRGYLWNDDRFINIISLPETIEAYWNGLWDDNGEEISAWKSIEHTSVITWEGTDSPVIHTQEEHRYSISDDTENKSVPDESTFRTVSSRNIEQDFLWNDVFRAFVISVVEDNDSGERFGVVEDFDNSVYYPLEEYSHFLGRVRVIDTNGNLSVREKSGLTFIP